MSEVYILNPIFGFRKNDGNNIAKMSDGSYIIFYNDQLLKIKNKKDLKLLKKRLGEILEYDFGDGNECE